MDTDDIATIIIRNSGGQYFAHQRSASKKMFPNMYGLGAGGHIQKNESPEAAARRELFEETGIRAAPKVLFSFPFSANDIDYTVYVHEVITEETVTPDDHEWQWLGWLTAAEVEALITESKLMPDTTLFYKRYVTDLEK